MTEKLRFVRLERVSLVHICQPTTPGPVHCNTNRVTQLALRSCPSTTGDIGGHSLTECFSAFWAGHCAVHGYSPVVLLCSVLK